MILTGGGSKAEVHLPSSRESACCLVRLLLGQQELGLVLDYVSWTHLQFSGKPASETQPPHPIPAFLELGEGGLSGLCLRLSSELPPSPD